MAAEELLSLRLVTDYCYSTFTEVTDLNPSTHVVTMNRYTVN